jgi:hypothetical protein
MKCEKCGSEITPETVHEHAGRKLCEDCCIDVLAAPRTCDPWAVYSAKNTTAQGVQLTSDQQKIVDLVKTEGPLTQERICAELGIGEESFRSDFATLRHLELMQACKMGGEIRYTLFSVKDH